MKRSTWSTIGVVLVCLGLAAPWALAERGKQREKQAEEAKRLSVQVAFGRGLNTAQPGNPVNHVILPQHIKVDQGGVVNFLVSGFHHIVVYKPGTELKEIQEFAEGLPTTATFIDFPLGDDEPFYLGLLPAGGPPNTAVTTNPLNTSNRVEPVGFPATKGRGTNLVESPKAEPGVYLVICNIRGHLLDGMFAFVEVKAEDEDD